MKSYFSVLALSAAAFYGTTAMAQTDDYKNYREVSRDTVDNVSTTRVVVDSVYSTKQTMTNGFFDNWFVFATGGAHSFYGDHSHLGGFSGTLSPDFSFGIGKWVTPGFGFKAEFIRSNSKGYTLPGYGYRYGDVLINSKGEKYQNMKTNW